MLKNIKRSLQKKKEESVETETGRRIIEDIGQAINKIKLTGMIGEIKYLSKSGVVVIKTKNKIAASELLFHKEILAERLRKQIKIRIL